jgi:hypothetical protein
MTMAQRTKFYFSKKTAKPRSQTEKLLGLSLSKDGFRDNNIFCDIQQYIPTDHTLSKLSGNNDQ